MRPHASWLRAQANQTPVKLYQYAVKSSMPIPGIAATSSRTAIGFHPPANFVEAWSCWNPMIASGTLAKHPFSRVRPRSSPHMEEATHSPRLK